MTASKTKRYWATNEKVWCSIVVPVQRLMHGRAVMVLCRRADGYEWYVPMCDLADEKPKKQTSRRVKG